MADEQTPNVDGISPTSDAPKQPEAEQPAQPSSAEVKKQQQAMSSARFVILLLFGLPYLLYCMWSFFLLAVLPDGSGTWDALIPYAKLLAMVGGGVLALGGLFAFIRVGKATKAADDTKIKGLVRIGLVILPGIALSMFTPYWISQEPPLRLQITSPKPGIELVAPLSVSFSAEEAVGILQRRGLSTKSFQWDYTGDGTTNEETVTPQ